MNFKPNYLIKSLYFSIFALIIYFSFIPIISVVFYGIFSGESFGITIAQVHRSIFYLNHSLTVSIIVTILSVLIGILLSITLWRLDFKYKKIYRTLALIPLINPPFIGSLAFIMLFGKRGLISHNLLGLSISPFGIHGIIIMQTLGLSAFAYILISSSIKNVDISLEEAARNLGTSELQIFFRITLPIMTPEIISTSMLIFLSSMADFGTPLIIGGNFQTLASDLYIQITGLYDMHSASVSGMFLMIPCVIAFITQRNFTEKKSYYSQNILNQNIEYKNIPIIGKYVLIGLSTIFIGFFCLKYGFIIIGAFTKQWGYDFSFTLDHVKTVLSKDFRPFINSIKLALGSSIISSFLGIVLGYFIKCKNLPFRKQLDFLATLPVAIPGILLGIGYLVTFKYPLLGVGRFIFKDVTGIILLGSGIIIYLICIFRYMNTGLRTSYALLEHINPNIEQAALNLGASESKIFFDIMLPILTPAFIASFYKNFSTIMTTLGAIIFLLLPKNKVAVQQIFQIITSSQMGVASSMAIMLSSITLIFMGTFKLAINFKSKFKTRR